MNPWFKKKENKKKFGFSLIEMVVVIGSLGIIIVAVISTILLTFRSQNMVKSNNKISENARSIVAELRRNVFNGDSFSIVCGVGGSSVSIPAQKDGEITILKCLGGNIVLNTTNLNSNEVTVFNCQNFATCIYKVGTSEIASVQFDFGLRTITAGVGVSQLYSTNVTTRN
jgi:type II secretory pathway pseudopilin PulG